jgi:hypothetical protein
MKSGRIEVSGFLGADDGYYAVVKNNDGSISGYLHLKAKPPLGPIGAGQPIGSVVRDHVHINACNQVAGCQHGAFPNPTFSGDVNSMTRFYSDPRLRYPRG